MNNVQRTMVIIISLSVITFVGALFINVKTVSPLSLSLIVTMSVLFIGAAIAFLQSLTGFSKRLKRAYLLLCAGIALLGLAQLQLPASILLGVQEQYWYKTGLQPLVYVGAIVTIFAGTRSFARLFDIKNLSTSPLFGLAVLVVLGAIIAVAPHGGPTVGTEANFDTNNVFSFASVVFFSLATLHILQIKRVASAAYTNALAWLFIGFGLTTIAGLFYVIYRMLIGESDLFLATNPIITGAFFTISGAALVRAAYSFAFIQTSTVAVSPLEDKNDQGFFGSAPKPATPARSSVDVVTYTANLASDSRAIDPLLDRLRIITANHKVNAGFSEAEETTLMKVYLDLEKYLVEKEKVRVFDRKLLRQKIADQLQLSSGQTTFWPKLPTTK